MNAHRTAGSATRRSLDGSVTAIGLIPGRRLDWSAGSHGATQGTEVGLGGRTFSTTLWDAEWIDVDGTLLDQWRRPLRETVEHQAQRWLKEKARSRVLLYRRRGSARELVLTVTRDDATGTR